MIARVLALLIVLCCNAALAQSTPECLGCENLTPTLEGQLSTPGDVRNLFVLNQICSGKGICKRRSEFEHPEWVETVLVKFVARFLERVDGWPGVLEGCGSYIVLGELFCADAMARQHIQVDLRTVMLAEGCGTDRDWLLIERIVRECLLESGNWVNLLGWLVIPLYRDQVRVDCLRDRAQAGLPLYTNAPSNP